MKYLPPLFALVAFVTGVLAAWYWYMSTEENIVPVWEKGDKGQDVMRFVKWVTSVNDTSIAVAKLNRKAALWTAASVLATGLTALFAAWA
jgi:hypothetical protein